MRALMFGWEFPPYISGGLGTACFGITKGLVDLGTEIIFVLPRIDRKAGKTHVKLVPASGVPLSGVREEKRPPGRLDFRTIDAALRPYVNESRYLELLKAVRGAAGGLQSGGVLQISGDYGPNLLEEIARYGRVAEVIARRETYDVIHAHDWMTVFAGVRASQTSGKPFVYHVHALEFDRSGENVNQSIYDIERYGMESACHIIAVSRYTKRIIVERYGIDPKKITVIHNGVSGHDGNMKKLKRRPGEKVVLFLGRITFQKGPDYFVEAAARVLEKIPGTMFVMAGSGDMLPRMIERVAELGMGKNFHFTGFLRGRNVERIYEASDLYVMPSVSEPFGISPLEAASRDVPVIISYQSGVSEVLNHVLKVDFWDVRELANKIIAVLSYPALTRELTERCRSELKGVSWANTAENILSVYRRVCNA
jgi:glycogen(starch) synthase